MKMKKIFSLLVSLTMLFTTYIPHGAVAEKQLKNDQIHSTYSTEDEPTVVISDSLKVTVIMKEQGVCASLFFRLMLRCDMMDIHVATHKAR